MLWPYKNNRGESSSQQQQSELLYAYPETWQVPLQPAHKIGSSCVVQNPLTQMYVHTHANIIYIYVSICFTCAEISVLLQSPLSRKPCVHLGLCLTGPTCGTFTICVLQSMMMLGKHTYPVSICMLSADLPSCLPD